MISFRCFSNPSRPANRSRWVAGVPVDLRGLTDLLWLPVKTLVVALDPRQGFGCGLADAGVAIRECLAHGGQRILCRPPCSSQGFEGSPPHERILVLKGPARAARIA